MEWIVALVLVIGLGVIGVVLIRHGGESDFSEAERIAEKIEIIDVTQL